MARRTEYYVEKVQGDIECCPNDQLYESNGVSSAKVEDILIDRNVPERLWDEVVDQLRCPKCDSEIEIWQRVGVKAQHAIIHERRVEKALARHNEKLFEFTNFLRSSPYLGALHPTGKRIVQEIAKLGGSTITDQSWFRARRVDGPIPLTVDDLRPPDTNRHTIPEGRFNHFGQACWYLANDPEAAAAEATSAAERLTWVQEWKIEQLRNVLDLRAWHADDDRVYDHDGEPIDFPLLPIALVFGDYLNAKPEKESGWRPEYFVPRFVADAARRAGLSGILFRSTVLLRQRCGGPGKFEIRNAQRQWEGREWSLGPTPYPLPSHLLGGSGASTEKAEDWKTRCPCFFVLEWPRERSGFKHCPTPGSRSW